MRKKESNIKLATKPIDLFLAKQSKI